MGYQVYEQTVYGVTRWAGYGVPAECDMPHCHVKIDRGLGYACEDCWRDERGDKRGCGLFFCSDHEYLAHSHVSPKAESVEWMQHILADDSWAEWREGNSEKVAEYAAAVKQRQNDVSWLSTDEALMIIEDELCERADTLEEDHTKGCPQEAVVEEWFSKAQREAKVEELHEVAEYFERSIVPYGTKIGRWLHARADRMEAGE